jgi:hypothetical protein
MSSAKISLELDEKNQIIRQVIEGMIDDEDSETIFKSTKELAARLKDPHKVRILAISDNMAKSSPKARKDLLNNIKDPDLYKIAVMGKNPYMKAVFSFILKVTGTRKTRIFSKEQDAVRWLTE